MRILLLDFQDDLHGPWLARRWDRILDLGRVPPAVYRMWSREAGCPVESVYDLQDLRDLYAQRELLAAGRNVVVDGDGIDWWDLLFHVAEREWVQVTLARRVAGEIGKCDGLVATRPSLMANALGLELNCPVDVLRSGPLQRVWQRAGHYAGRLRDLGVGQIRQVLYDKYDATYSWRRRFASRAESSPEPVVLLPSAYSNVSRTELAYARLLPEQKFLLVTAREHAAIEPLPDNVRSVELAAYAEPGSVDELVTLKEKWGALEQKLSANPAMRTASKLGVVGRAASLLRWGLAVRDAWKVLFEAESVVGCLSADDFNPYTRVPLILARQRRIRTIACHHGAFDGRLAYKEPDSDVYLAKGAMEEDYVLRVCGVERNLVRVGAPVGPQEKSGYDAGAPWLVYFSEPYEIGFWRTEAIYGEILPHLCHVARSHQKKVVLKLHPFENAEHRRRMLRDLLTPDDLKLVSVVATPMSPDLLRRTWCGVVGVSTAALDCVLAGIPTFLCGWLPLTHVGYAEQFARFGVGRMLEKPEELLRIAELMGGAMPESEMARNLVRSIEPAALASWLLPSVTETRHA
jgi:hypothetical protein